jgi:D-arabinose 1-dehydrogenase-like Zn-dependent alcohol dehydrogenase
MAVDDRRRPGVITWPSDANGTTEETTMTVSSRAVVLEEFDEPLELREYDVPEPGEMAAVVEYGGVCGTDLHLHHGGLPIPTPVVLGHEAVGRARKLRGLTHDVLGTPLAEARRDGQYCVVGQYTHRGPTPVNPHLVTRKQLHVHGSWGFSARNYIRYVLSVPRLVERFDLARLLTECPLDRPNEAVAEVERGEVVKAVLHAGAA